MRISAKAEYAVRAAVELAAADGEKPLKAARIAEAQEIPLPFLENLMGDLRQSGVVRSHRGPEGGFALDRPAAEITLADVIRAVDGPLASIRGGRPEDTSYGGAAEPLTRIWIALRANLRAVLEATTLADVVSGRLPAPVQSLADDPDAWQRR
ncbi:MAG: Rrf2 family transcriptional regulator [Solirubrobacterales bacterium]|jgi:Rrf2 family protein|nr:Rrf2 family transcriptional regulator [Solirubrobacterales bacterium]